MLNGYTNEYTVLYYHDLPNIAVLITVNNEEWGSVNLSKVLVERGTQATRDGNVLHIGTLDVIATANAPTAQYTFEFSGWSGIPLDGRIVQDLTVTANFTATVNQYDVTITVNDDTYGTVDVTTVTVDYGTVITQEGNILSIGDNVITATASDPAGIYSYKFARWDGIADIVSGTMTITAVFSKTVDVPASEYIDGITHKEYDKDGGIIGTIFMILPLLMGLMIIAGLAYNMGAFRR